MVSYNREIRPLMSDKCFACHGPDLTKVKAGLRLDLPSRAFAELEKTKGKYAIVPGFPEQSELIHRIESLDPEIIIIKCLEWMKLPSLKPISSIAMKK